MAVIPFPTGRLIPEFDMADRLRKSARVAGLTNRQMASMLGVNESSVSGWINGAHRPSRQTLMVWSQMTDVDFRWLETGELPTTPPEGGDSAWARWGSNPRPADYRGVGSHRNRITFADFPKRLERTAA